MSKTWAEAGNRAAERERLPRAIGRRMRSLAKAAAGLALLAVVAGCTGAPRAGAGANGSAPPTVLSRDGALGVPATQSGVIAGASQGVVATGAPAIVALLAPVGSSNAGVSRVGRALEDAAELAIRDIPAGLVTLKVYDTAGQPEQARSAAERAAAEGASLIIGPLFAESVRAVAPVAQQNGLAVLAFSTDPTVAGGNVFLVSFLTEDEIARVVDYAALQGISRYGAVAPYSPLGEVGLAALRHSVSRQGGELVAATRYQSTFQGIEEGARAYAAEHEAAEAISPVQAVLLADQGQALQSAAAYLAYFDVSPQTTKFFGPGTWNDPGSTKEIALHGGWFAGPDQRLKDAFDQRYESIYGTRPHRLASLAYDAVAVAATLVSESRRSAQTYPFTPETLTDPSGFRGANGVFRLLPNGLNERGLAIYQVTGDGFVEIDRAPMTFAGL